MGRNRVDRKRLTFSKLSIKDEGSKKICTSLHINTLAVPQMGYKIVMEGLNVGRADKNSILSTLYVMTSILL